MAQSLRVIDLGRTHYDEVLALQRRLHASRVAGQSEDVLLLTEHEPVITLGRNAERRHIRASPDTLAQRGIGVVEVERGGDVTYHGPGQLVAYPILDLRAAGLGVREYVRRLEQTAIALAEQYGVVGRRRPGMPGVWVGDRKLASVGVYVSHWVTMHGIAINVAPDLSAFGLIDPCGLVDVEMTSVERERAVVGMMVSTKTEAVRGYVTAFGEVFVEGKKSVQQACKEIGPRFA